MALQQNSLDSLKNLHNASRRRLRKHLSPPQAAIVRQLGRGRDLLFYTGSADARYEHLAVPPLVTIRKPAPNVQAIVLTATADTASKTGERIAAGAGKPASRSGGIRVVSVGSGDASRQEADRISEQPDVVVGTAERIIDHIRRDNLDIGRVRLCVVDEPNEDRASRFNADVEYIFSKISSATQSVVFAETAHEHVPALTQLLRRPAVVNLSDFGEWSRNGGRNSNAQESGPVYDQDFKHLLKDETLKDWMNSILEELHEEVDPDELDAYRKVIKKHVPFFRRGYFAAYLLKEMREKEGGDRGARAGSKPGKRHGGKAGGGRRSGDRSGSDAVRDEQSTEAEQGYKTMFVGVGKNRKVFPRDLIQLFSNVDDITGSDIGQIKILDNYSFVELAEAKAESAIEELNGKEYRGRKLNVNYARKKD